MDEDKFSGGAGVGIPTGNGGGFGDSSRASSSFMKSGDRQMFTVELRPGETTIVSWKKLVKDANKVNGLNTVPEPPANPNPVVECRIDPVRTMFSLLMYLVYNAFYFPSKCNWILLESVLVLALRQSFTT